MDFLWSLQTVVAYFGRLEHKKSPLHFLPEYQGLYMDLFQNLLKLKFMVILNFAHEQVLT